MKTCHYGFEDHLETFEVIDLSRNLSNRKKENVIILILEI